MLAGVLHTAALVGVMLVDARLQVDAATAGAASYVEQETPGPRQWRRERVERSIIL